MKALTRCLSFVVAVGLAACTDAGGSWHAEGSSEERIIGGRLDTDSRSVMGIVMRGGGLCSGSLILPNLVLTAHHCVANLSSGNGSVQCGSTTFGQPRPPSDFAVSWDENLTDGAPDDSVFDVNLVRVPPDNDVCGNDVALLQLASNVPAERAQPIEPRVGTAPMENEEFDAVGYGLTNPNDQAGTTAGKRMRFDGVRVGCVGASPCRGTGATATEWAAEAPVCSGDSGGPALDTAGRVIGVASRGPQECDFAVYSAVSPWKDFILEAAMNAADAGGYDPPGWVTGMTTPDAGAPMPDGGLPNDAGMPSDAGIPIRDAGMPLPDAGMYNDAGAPLPDAGIRSDAGPSPSDAGTPIADAGMPLTDAGTHTMDDGGRATDASVADEGPADAAPLADPGCTCRTDTGPARTGFAWQALGLIALALTLLRRR